MARFQDPALLTHDYIFDYHLIETDLLGGRLLLFPRSLGYGILFLTFNFVLDHIWLSKWLVFILVPLSVGYLFKLGQFLEDNLTAASLSLLFVFFILASSQAISPLTGLQRAFAIPLLIIFFYYLVQERYIGAGVLMVSAALIYWPNLPLMALTYVLSFIRIKSGYNISVNLTRAKVLPLLISSLFIVILIALELSVELRLFAPKEVAVSQNPNYQSGGSTPMFISFPLLGRAGIFNIGNEIINFAILLILAFLVYKVVGRRSWQRLPIAYWYLLVAGIIMYAASFFSLFVLSSSILYLPSRYTRVTLILCAILFVGLNWGDFLKQAPTWFRRKASQLIFFIVSLIVALGLVYIVSPNRILLVSLALFFGTILSGLVTVLGASAIYWWIQTHRQAGWIKKFIVPLIMLIIVLWSALFHIRTLGTKLMNPTNSQRDIYEFVATLPKEAIFAGDPELMSGIPLFSKRSVLFRDLHPNANPNVTPFILDYYDAQYAESSQSILDMCQKYQVSYLVLDMDEFESEYLAEREFFYQPWNDEIVRMVDGRSNFILPQLQPVFTSGPFRVIKCDEDTISTGSN